MDADDVVLRSALQARLDRSPARLHTSDVVVLAMLRSFDPAVFLTSALSFALSLEASAAARWRSALTRTVFLVGNPSNLATRVAFDHLSEDGTLAWVGPVAAASSMGLRRMLTLFRAERPVGRLGSYTVAAQDANPLSGRTLRLDVATSGVTVSDYLVHVNHSIAEAVIDGHVGANDRLTVRHIEHLNADHVARSMAARVHRDTIEHTRWRAYTTLTGVTDR